MEATSPSAVAPSVLSLGDDRDVLAAALGWVKSGRRAALATVIHTWGSSPRPVGSLMAIAEDGAMLGSVSGGCIEGAVVKEALESIETGEPKRLEFGVSNEQAWDVGLACGGTVHVYVERLV
jgi:xanthine/CO dehydrogenase XdhC/CoxF family maturation factor